MQLPEDCHLAYIVTHEAWYANAMPDRQPEIYVTATTEDDGSAWEFGIREADFENRGVHPISVHVFDDAFAAFAQIPEFFAALAAEEVTTLGGVRTLLANLGAADETERKGAGGDLPAKATAKRIRHAIAAAANASLGMHGLIEVSADDATAAVMRVLGADTDAR